MGMSEAQGEPMGDTAVVQGVALLSPQQLADYLGIPVATVHRWRYESTGPRASRLASTSGTAGGTWRLGWRRGPTPTSRGAPDDLR